MRSPTPTPPHSHTPTPTSRWWDLLAVLLLLAALFTTAARLVATQWADHLNLVPFLTFLGALAGLALGWSIFSARQSAAFAFAYGLFAILWRLGLTLGEGILWTERLTSLGGRLIVALDQLVRREVVEDPLFFLSLMLGLFWVLSVHAGYNLTRHARPWHAILPAGITLLNIQISDPFVTSRVWFMAGYLLFSVLLLARLTYLHHYARWQRDHVLLPLYIGFDLTRVTLTITVLLVLVAWTMPAMVGVLPSAEEAWQRATQPWTIVSDRLNKAFAHLRRTSGLVEYYAYYGEHLSLGRGSELPDTLIMTVEAPPRPAASPRYYWRARVYDYYAGGRWISTLTTPQSVTPDHFDLTFPEAEGRWTATFAFDLAVPIVTLYTAPQPLWVSRPAQADLAHNPDGTADLTALHADPPLRAGETYQVQSSLSTATIAQLRAAGTDYPLWVTDRYLQIPSTVTTRTLELARQSALGMDNAYDIAASITTYLRTHIQYSETIPPLPPPAAGGGERGGQDPLDWFLFDLHQGFCNYYASAEVILLRSLGIPARLAVGFAQGERQDAEEGDIYLVRHHDAHAWPEVYFPGLGWVEFEPTASQRSIYRPLGEESASADSATGSTTAPPVGGPEGGFPDDRLDRIEDAELNLDADVRKTVARRNLFLLLGLVLVFFAWRVYRRRDLPPLPILLETGLRRMGLVEPPPALSRWARHVALAPLERAYVELDYALARLDAPPAPADTPAERAAALTHLLPAAADPAQQLLAEYHAATYSPRPGNLYVAQQAAHAIRDLSWRARIRQLVVRR